MKSTQKRTGMVSDMKELNDEIKLTINTMQCDIDDGAHSELQFHLYSLLDMKRDRLVAKTGLQAEIERERERRFEGNRIASAEHRDEVERLVEALEFAESTIAQYRKEHVTHDQAPPKSWQLANRVEPLTTEELKAGSWAVDSSEECLNALIEKGFAARYAGLTTEEGYKYCNLAGDIVVMTPTMAHNAALKQILLIGNEFYWGKV